jgi:predicted TIM-barrel fold metal-dependent hydrolase
MVHDSPGEATGARLLVISADCHAGPERVIDYQAYTPAALRDSLQEYVAQTQAFDADQARAASSGLNRGGATVREDEGLWDMCVRQARLDADGIVAEVIFPQGAVPFASYPAVGATRMDWTATPEQRDAGPGIYNRLLADFCSANAKLHYGVAVLPIANVELAVEEVARARESGLNGGVSLPPIRDDRQYNDPAYDRLWAACQDHDMVVNVHGGSENIYRGGPEVRALIFSETDFFTRRSLWFLLFSGVFERYPRLRLAITEQRAHWVPSMLADLDSIYRSARCADLRKQLPRLPSEYFATNCFVGASFMSKTECAMRDQIGVDRLMWGSDYPHTEGVWPWVREGLRWTFEGVGETELRRMLGGNAIDCYGFDAECLAVRAAEIGPTVEEVASSPLDAPPDEPGVAMSWAFRTTAWV